MCIRDRLDTKNKELQKILKDADSIKNFLNESSIDLLNNIKNEFSDICDIDID